MTKSDDVASTVDADQIKAQLEKEEQVLFKINKCTQKIKKTK